MTSRSIRAFLIAPVGCFLVASSLLAQREEEKRLEEAGTIMREILNVPDNIPQTLLNHARCVVVLPHVMKAALGVGGSVGRGTTLCRTGPNFSGPWSAPAMYSLEGATFGFQIGGQAADVVLLVMNDAGASNLLRNKFTLGADASVSAGPTGREAAVDTDAYLRSDILSYSRSRGVFAGVSLSGATLHPDNGADKALYGRSLTAKQIVEGPGSPQAPSSAKLIVSELTKASPPGISKA